MVRQEQAINQLGIIFEVAFNVGIMATLENLGIRHHNDYTEELKLLHPNQIIKYYTEELSVQDKTCKKAWEEGLIEITTKSTNPHGTD